MYSKSRHAAALVFCVVLGWHGLAWGADLSGRVYEGQVGDESTPLAGVTIGLYGAFGPTGSRTLITTTTTDSTGWYGVTAETGYEFYTIVAESGPDASYSFEGASSVDGSASGNEIQYSIATQTLDDQTLTGNKFWYSKDSGGTSEPPGPGQNNAPTANDDSASTALNTAVDIDVLSNDTDPDGDPLHINTVTDPPHGTAVNHGSHVTYTPDPGYSGTDTFDYTAGDGRGGTDTATVTVDVDDAGGPGEPPAPPEGTGVIRGTKFNDLNGNGQRDPGEPGLAGWEIHVYFSGPNWWVDLNTTTDASGSYGFLGLGVGTYEVYEVGQSGWSQTYPGGDGRHTVSLQDGQVLQDVDFGNRQGVAGEPPEGTGAIRGTKFHDLNGNGQRDPGEPGLAGWVIVLQDSEGNALTQTTTDANGNYEFPGQDPGAYRVDEVQQAGWRRTYPEVDGQPAYWAIGLERGDDVEEADFGNIRDGGGGSSSVGDLVWEDTNGNGLQEPGEPGIGGVLVVLLDTGGNQIAATTTGAGGYYSFSDVAPGDYVVRFVLPAGYVFSGSNMGNDDAIDSDANPSTGDSDPLTQGPGEHDDTVDAGMIREGDTPGGPGEGSVTVVKKATPADDTPFQFCADYAPGGFFDVLCQNLQDPSLPTWTVSNPALIERVTETVPVGWTLKNVTITGDADQGSAIDLSQGRVDVDYDEGEHIVIVFENVKEGYDGLDYGDAPASYGIASHTVATNISLGAAIDIEGAPNTSPGAGGDDAHGIDDEDAMSLDTGLALGRKVEVCLEMHNAGATPQDVFVAGWIDFDGDGQFGPGIEHLFTRPVHLPPHSIVRDCGQITVPTNAKPGTTFGRFRMFVDDLEPGVAFAALPTGDGGDGEVEDYLLYILSDAPGPDEGRDYGDAPAPYPDASHVVSGPWLGSTAPDAEAGTQASATASGDDSDGIDDEDGPLFVDDMVPGGWSMIGMQYITSGSIVTLKGWVDFNADGDWDDANEEVYWLVDHSAVSGLQMSGIGFAVPAGAVVGKTLARFRICEGVANSLSPSGAGGRGEVEDFEVEIKASVPGGPSGGIVHGYKWNDLDGDGLWDIAQPVEPPLAGWTFWLDINKNGLQDAGDMSAVTDATGHFRIPGVPPGTYTLSEQLQAGWVQTIPGGAGTYSVTVQSGQGTFPQMFGNRRSDTPGGGGGTVWALKWNDLDGNGIYSLSEPPVANWQMYLDLNKNGQLDPGEPRQMTDANGECRFTGLADGTYVLAEVMQPGWQQTSPGGAGTYTETVVAGGATSLSMFGNQQIGGPGPGPGQQLDWGDAPDPTYATLSASGGASHAIVAGMHLGPNVSGEVDGQPHPEALGDDLDGDDDEDGVFFLTPLMPGDNATIEVVVPSAGRLDAWIDFGADGSWAQPSDQIFKSEAILDGANILPFPVPAGAVADMPTYARFRFSSAGGLAPGGPASDGEVEDYCLVLGEHGPAVAGEPGAPHIKWSQPPIEIDPDVEADPVFCGWGEPARSTQDEGGRRNWRMDADDFRCLGPIPVTRVRWWGTYKAWSQPEPPEHQPEGWHVGVWANQVEGLEPNESYPERLVWSVEVPFERVHIDSAGRGEFPGRLPETCFVYELGLEPEEWFHEGQFESHEDIFWISITAIYPPDAPNANNWSWQTRPHVWGRGAVVPAIMGEWPSGDERLFPGRIYPVESDALCGENQGFDLCFELLTEEPWIKWDQPFTGWRDWLWYASEMAMGREQEDGERHELRVVADDWLCERQDPIVAISWHGSYLEYGYAACQCEPPPEPRPDFFLLAIYTSAPADDWEPYEHPGEKIWEYAAETYDEVLVGYTAPLEGRPNEAVFRYSARVPEEAWFRQGEPGTVYWFTVTPVLREPTRDVDRPSRWGWTDHPQAFGGGALLVDYRLRMVPQWQAVRDPEDRAVDMSFEFFTVPSEGP